MVVIFFNPGCEFCARMVPDLAALAAGATRGQVAAAIFGSQEFQQDLVQGLFGTFLGRTADSGSLNGFVNAMQHGATDQQVIAAIAGSDEFFARLQ